MRVPLIGASDLDQHIPASGPAAPNFKKRVSIIEDDALVRDVLYETLTAHGYTATAYADSCDAIRVSRKWPDSIHLILTDIGVLGKAGLQELQRVIGNHSQTKVLLTSGYVLCKDIEDLRRELAYPYIAKPFSSSELI